MCGALYQYIAGNVSHVGGQFSDDSTYPVPDLTVPIVGYRGWGLNEKGQLKSVLAGTVWEKPILRAECVEISGWQHSGQSHKAPHPDCSCGIYAYWRNHYSYANVFGAVVLTGRIQVHCEGLRAEHARIVALCNVPSSNAYAGSEIGAKQRSIIETIGEAWGVPVVPKEDLAQIANEFGEPVPERYVEEARRLNAETHARKAKEMAQRREELRKQIVKAGTAGAMAAMFGVWWLGGHNDD